MTIRIGKQYIKDLTEEKTTGKTLPNMFNDTKNDFWKYVMTSFFIFHPLILGIFWGIWFLLLFLGLVNPLANRPDFKTKDIEFVITQKEEMPINKKTPYRSDKNSRAGGIHDPNRKVEMPNPSPAPAPKPVKQQVAQAPAPKQIVKQTPKQQTVQKPAQQPKVAQTQAPKGVSKPAKTVAPVQRPVLKPSTSTPKPQMPKLASAPSSPFKVAVPNTGAPVGKGFSTSNGTASSGGGAQGSNSGSSKGNFGGMPAPQFSTTKIASSGTGSGAKTSSGTGRGGYGTGNMGNPGPGNPKGAPGIDSIKSPQWGPYMKELESKIKRNWNPPKGDQSKRVVLLFKIGRKGELLSTKIVKPSNSSANDQAAIRAVQMSAPFRALPPEYTGSSVEIEFTFDYNVFGANYR